MVKPGYKQTEIGLIPEEWEIRSAKDLMRIETGSRNTEHKADHGQYPFFVRSQQVERIDSYHYDCEAVLTAGDGVGTGKVFHYFDGKFDAHQRVYVMSNFNGVLGKYFFYFFSKNFSSEVLKYTAKSSVDSVRRDMIAEMLIPLPLENEQANICEAIFDVDQLIEILEKQISKKRAIKQGAMQELLTGKRRLPGFADKWIKRTIGDIACIESGGTPSTTVGSYWNGKISWCTPTDITENKSKYIGNTEKTITKEGVLNSSAKLLPKGTILLCTRATIGESSIATDVITTNQGFKNLICNDDVYNEFLYYALQMKKTEMLSLAIGSTFLEISKNALSGILIDLPDNKDEQVAIAGVLSDIDEEIELLVQKLAKYRQLKQGMMQQLLTGKTRLV